MTAPKAVDLPLVDAPTLSFECLYPSAAVSVTMTIFHLF